MSPAGDIHPSIEGEAAEGTPTRVGMHIVKKGKCPHSDNRCKSNRQSTEGVRQPGMKIEFIHA